jgi:antitoxin component YwqK of YwqJK toxin-antitoxin module
MSSKPHFVEIPYDTGEIWCRYSRVLAPEGTGWIRHGLYREYERNGQIISEGAYKDGKEEGPWRVWYPNGQLAAEGQFAKGEGFGWRYWNSDGAPIEITSGSSPHGIPHGPHWR